MKTILIVLALCVALYVLRFAGYFIWPVILPVAFFGGGWCGWRLRKWWCGPGMRSAT